MLLPCPVSWYYRMGPLTYCFCFLQKFWQFCFQLLLATEAMQLWGMHANIRYFTFLSSHSTSRILVLDWARIKIDTAKRTNTLNQMPKMHVIAPAPIIGFKICPWSKHITVITYRSVIYLALDSPHFLTALCCLSAPPGFFLSFVGSFPGLLCCTVIAKPDWQPCE